MKKIQYNLRNKIVQTKIGNKGLTITTLAITIVVIIMLASIGIYTGTDIIKRANLQNINTNMMLIQAKTKTIMEQAKFNKDTSNYKGTKLTELGDNKKVDELIENHIIERNENYYFLTQTNLNEMGLEKIKADDGYIVEYETNEIIYVKGFSANNQTYYKLSEMKNVNVE